MIQATGLTLCHRRHAAPVLDDVSFTARPGCVTGLLGPSGAGKTIVIRRMLDMVRGVGVTLFDGVSYAQLLRPAQEVGVMLADPTYPPSHRARTRMRLLASALDVPRTRADEVLDLVGLGHVAKRRPRDFSAGMGRRLALAAALLGDPHTLVLDDPSAGLDPPAAAWLRSFLQALAAQGRVVLVTGDDPGEMTALADHVVLLDEGRVLADQSTAEYRRTRMRREVVVRSPHAHRLADLLTELGGEVVQYSGTRLVLAGMDPSRIGEVAHRNGMLLHELADRVVSRGQAPGGVCSVPGRDGERGDVAARGLYRVGDADSTPARGLRVSELAGGATASSGTLDLEPLDTGRNAQVVAGAAVDAVGRDPRRNLDAENLDAEDPDEPTEGLWIGAWQEGGVACTEPSRVEPPRALPEPEALLRQSPLLDAPTVDRLQGRTALPAGGQACHRVPVGHTVAGRGTAASLRRGRPLWDETFGEEI